MIYEVNFTSEIIIFIIFVANWLIYCLSIHKNYYLKQQNVLYKNHKNYYLKQ